jgi:heme/copper-type cytochrome/quinol oxidase subunit 2
MSSNGPDRPDLRLGPPAAVPPPPTRRGWSVRLFLLSLGAFAVVVAVAIAGYQWGSRRDVAQPRLIPPPTSGAGKFSAADPAPASARTTPTMPPRPQLVGTLIARSKGTDPYSNRVFNAAGQGSSTAPRFVARAGEPIRIRVINRDSVQHSFTMDAARINVDVPAHTSEAATFTAPMRAGTYSFYCRYRKPGMNGTLVVRGT